MVLKGEILSTRSLTTIESEWDGKEIVVICRQMDGYHEGRGRELAEWLKDICVVNGISYGVDRKLANGMSCLAAQMISHFKTEPGSFYIHPAGSRDLGEEYLYRVYLDGEGEISKRQLKISCFSGPITMFGVSSKEGTNIPPEFDGTPKAFLKWCNGFSNNQ